MGLADNKCVPCRGGVPPLPNDRSQVLLKELGRGWSLNAAMLLPDELDAAVIYYGHVTDDEERLRPVEAPILGLFGAEDRGIPVDLVRRFDSALDRLDKDHTIHIYPGAGHAFANPTGENYDRDAAEDAWQKSLEFLAQKLSVE